MRHDVIISGHYINTLRAQYGRETQSAAIRELVDNSVDANATSITITFNSSLDEIVIEDNGDGCSDVGMFFNIGSSDKVGEGKVGRYGIGGTWACLFLSDKEYVVTNSRSSGLHSSAKMDWSSVAEHGRKFQWEGHQPRPMFADENPGTKITLCGIRRGNTESRG
ncbi:MAG: ATP-binding protein, partial [Opitutaceae bacterium]|nr:ATP-binding protein [Opitutaceae bacterium]